MLASREINSRLRPERAAWLLCSVLGHHARHSPQNISRLDAKMRRVYRRVHAALSPHFMQLQKRASGFLFRFPLPLLYFASHANRSCLRRFLQARCCRIIYQNFFTLTSLDFDYTAGCRRFGATFCPATARLTVRQMISHVTVLPHDRCSGTYGPLSRDDVTGH